MIEISQFEENFTYSHFNNEKLKGYIYENVFDETFFAQLKNQVEKIFTTNNTKTWLTHTSTFNFNNQYHKIVSHHQNDREQHVIFDLYPDSEWRFQTSQTIKQWADNKIEKEVSPYFIKTIKKFYTLAPFNTEINKWMCYRLHLNSLKYEKFLSLHIDSNHQLYNTKDVSTARSLSITFYLYDHIPNCGGELFSINGFVYKPKRNSAICINGTKVFHGVTMNKNPTKETRLAFTMRFVHVDDLYLPGHPDKFLYKVI